MNLLLASRYRDCLLVTEGDKPAAAILVVAEIIASGLRTLPVPVLPSARFCTVAEAAARLGLTSRAVYDACLAGKLRPTRSEETIYISSSEIDRYQRGPLGTTRP